MSKFTSPLNDLKIASPCPADWNAMLGDDRVRYCGECKLNVYNLSGMTTEDAERLIIGAEGRLCVRFYRRQDGSVITKDCPVGWAKMRQQTKKVAVAAGSMITALFTGLLAWAAFGESTTIGFHEEEGRAEVGAITYSREPANAPIMGGVPAPRKSTLTEVDEVERLGRLVKHPSKQSR